MINITGLTRSMKDLNLARAYISMASNRSGPLSKEDWGNSMGSRAILACI